MSGAWLATKANAGTQAAGQNVRLAEVKKEIARLLRDDGDPAELGKLVHERTQLRMEEGR